MRYLDPFQLKMAVLLTLILLAVWIIKNFSNIKYDD